MGRKYLSYMNILSFALACDKFFYDLPFFFSLANSFDLFMNDAQDRLEWKREWERKSKVKNLYVFYFVKRKNHKPNDLI